MSDQPFLLKQKPSRSGELPPQPAAIGLNDYCANHISVTTCQDKFRDQTDRSINQAKRTLGAINASSERNVRGREDLENTAALQVEGREYGYSNIELNNGDLVISFASNGFVYINSPLIKDYSHSIVMTDGNNELHETEESVQYHRFNSLANLEGYDPKPSEMKVFYDGYNYDHLKDLEEHHSEDMVLEYRESIQTKNLDAAQAQCDYLKSVLNQYLSSTDGSELFNKANKLNKLNSELESASALDYKESSELKEVQKLKIDQKVAELNEGIQVSENDLEPGLTFYVNSELKGLCKCVYIEPNGFNNEFVRNYTFHRFPLDPNTGEFEALPDRKKEVTAMNTEYNGDLEKALSLESVQKAMSY